jgi:hypothetical protein
MPRHVKEEELKARVHFRCDEPRDKIVSSDSNKRSQLFELVRWADEVPEVRVKPMVKAAAEERPNSQGLTAVNQLLNGDQSERHQGG